MNEESSVIQRNSLNENDGDDDSLHLSEQALAALYELNAEQKILDKSGILDENWQLSQFWYSDETADTLANECVKSLNASGSIALVSCPTVMERLSTNKDFDRNYLRVKLLEYDKRFAQRFPFEFVFYDYNEPTCLPENCHNEFDLIVIDPPFLSEECFVKFAETVRLLSKSANTKLIICTGVIMESTVERLFSAHRCHFVPTHRRNLANEFACFANYKTALL
uniref:Protein-lysine N-methyltransferase n=1 Tax=Syphacia muris TaxID=451379 RepID=A0A0N5AMT5_9BILA